jgi:hypothetical protein
LEQAEWALGMLSDEARSDAEEALGLCRAVAAGSAADDAARRLLALVERLARRTTRAIPYATLGRAALAELSGRPKDACQLLNEAMATFSRLGM